MSEQARAESLMRRALEHAQQAASEDEVPVGAVVARGDRIVGAAHDRRMALRDPTAHAELLAIREAAATLGDWRLEGCDLFVTLEPCAMCAGAILLARIDCLYYGAPNPKFGAVGSRLDLLGGDWGWNHRVRVEAGLLAEECGRLLSEYFRTKR
jgi:tRNA(adenine34) deaminase